MAPTKLDEHSIPTGPKGWEPALQTTQPLEAGYFRVEATTCASAAVVGFTPAPAGSEQSIDISFDCQPDQAFVLHWFPNVQYRGIDAGTWHSHTRQVDLPGGDPNRRHGPLDTTGGRASHGDVSTPPIIINLP